MRITLVRLPFYVLLGNLKPVYHIGLSYISSVLKNRGHEVTLVDAETMRFEGLGNQSGKLGKTLTRLMPSKYLHIGYAQMANVMENPEHRNWEILAKAIVATEPELVGITCFSQNLTALIYLTRKLKDRLPETRIVVGGIHPSADPEGTMQCVKDIDYLVIGEGEETIAELCEELGNSKGQFVRRIRGLAYRENEQTKITPRRQLIENLDEIPFPDRTLGNREDYYNAETIFTSRGCPFICTFCASNILWTRRVRYRSLDNVLAEITFLSKDHHSMRIRIDDDTFTLSKKRVLDFCERIKASGFGKAVSFSLGSRVDALDEEMARALSGIGTDTISFGIESGSPRSLERISKKIIPGQVEKAIALCTDQGIRCLCYFMIGHPYETVDDVKRSIKLFDKIANRFVDAELNLVTPYPGTQLYSLMEEKGLKLEPRDHYRLFHQGDILVNLSGMTDDELRGYYDLFSKRISLHGALSKMNSIVHLVLAGRVGTAMRLIMN